MTLNDVRVDVSQIPDVTRTRLAKGMLEICQRIQSNPALHGLLEQERAALRAERNKRSKRA